MPQENRLNYTGTKAISKKHDAAQSIYSVNPYEHSSPSFCSPFLSGQLFADSILDDRQLVEDGAVN